MAEPLSKETVTHLLTAMTTLSESPYLHWDELRHRTPPNELSIEEWWLVTKLARRSIQRALPLVAQDGSHFIYALTDSVLKPDSAQFSVV